MESEERSFVAALLRMTAKGGFARAKRGDGAGSIEWRTMRVEGGGRAAALQRLLAD
jgi:hypothetical protein